MEASNAVHVLVRESDDGRAKLTLMSDYIPCLDLDIVPTMSAAQASKIVMQDLGISRLITVQSSYGSYSAPGVTNPYATYLYPSSGLYGPAYSSAYTPYGAYIGGNPYGTISPYGTPCLPNSAILAPSSVVAPQKQVEQVVPNLIIFPFGEEGDIYLCWEFKFHLEEPYGPFGSHYYFIDAHTGEIISHVRPEYSAVTSSDTSSSSTTSNLNSASNTPYSAPVYDASGTVYTPFSTPATAGNPGWFPGNSFNLIPNYNISYNNSYFPLSSSLFQSTVSSPVRGLDGSYLNTGSYNLLNNLFSPYSSYFPSSFSPFAGGPYPGLPGFSPFLPGISSFLISAIGNPSIASIQPYSAQYPSWSYPSIPSPTSIIPIPRTPDTQLIPSPAPVEMTGTWQSQQLTDGNGNKIQGKLTINRKDESQEILKMSGSSLPLDEGSLAQFIYTPTRGDAPIFFKALFDAGYTAEFTGTADNVLCPQNLYCAAAGFFTVKGQYVVKNAEGQIVDKGTFDLSL